MTDDLRWKLRQAREGLERAQEAKQRADLLSASARELGGGLLSFGGSGKQSAKRTVQGAQGRAFTAHNEADERIAHWTTRISSLERRIAESERVRFTAADLAGATHVRNGIGWHQVVRVNGKSVTVLTPHSWTDRIAVEQILEHRTIAP